MKRGGNFKARAVQLNSDEAKKLLDKIIFFVIM